MTETIKESPTAVPPNPFRLVRGNPAFVEATSVLRHTAFVDGQRVQKDIVQPMRLNSGVFPYEQIMQLMERCRCLEEENERLRRQVESLPTEGEERKRGRK